MRSERPTITIPAVLRAIVMAPSELGVPLTDDEIRIADAAADAAVREFLGRTDKELRRLISAETDGESVDALKEIAADGEGREYDTVRVVCAPMPGPVALDRPMTVAEADAAAGEGCYITGVVAVDLDELVDNDLEGLLDILGERLVEHGLLLSDISYRVAGVQDAETLLVEVKGDIGMILDSYGPP
jgi:hypothetical protein